MNAEFETAVSQYALQKKGSSSSGGSKKQSYSEFVASLHKNFGAERSPFAKSDPVVAATNPNVVVETKAHATPVSAI